jgi:hypothetical protein
MLHIDRVNGGPISITATRTRSEPLVDLQSDQRLDQAECFRASGDAETISSSFAIPGPGSKLLAAVLVSREARPIDR